MTNKLSLKILKIKLKLIDSTHWTREFESVWNKERRKNEIINDTSKISNLNFKLNAISTYEMRKLLMQVKSNTVARKLRCKLAQQVQDAFYCYTEHSSCETRVKDL